MQLPCDLIFSVELNRKHIFFLLEYIQVKKSGLWKLDKI